MAVEWDSRKEVQALVARTDDLSMLYRGLGFSPQFLSLVSRWVPILRSEGSPGNVLALVDDIERGLKFSGTHLARRSVDKLTALLNSAREDLQRGSAPDLKAIAEELEYAAEHGGGWPAEYHKEELDDLLSSLLYVRHEYRLHDPYFRETIVEQASTYFRSPFMHTTWLTRRLLVDLLAADVEVLGREALATHDPAHVWGQLPAPWGTIVPWIVSTVFSIVGVAGAVFLYLADMAWAAVLVGTYVAWRAFWRIWRRMALAKARAPLVRIAARLQVVLNEISSGHYYPQVALRRLRQQERAGYFVHSYIFRLLELETRSERPAADVEVDAAASSEQGPPESADPDPP